MMIILEGGKHECRPGSFLHLTSSIVSDTAHSMFSFTTWTESKMAKEKANQSSQNNQGSLSHTGVYEYKYIYIYIICDHAASTCAMPQTLLGWLSGTSFFVTITVLCGLPLCRDDLSWCPPLRFVRDVIDDPLRGFGWNPFAVFNTFYISPKENPEKREENLKEPWRNPKETLNEP